MTIYVCFPIASNQLYALCETCNVHKLIKYLYAFVYYTRGEFDAIISMVTILFDFEM